MRKLKTGSKRWKEALIETVLTECPELIECPKCGRPHRDGYCCGHCGYAYGYGEPEGDPIVLEEYF